MCTAVQAAWRACSNDTAVRHLDVDAPRVLKGLYEQELNGMWAYKTVQCSTGLFTPGDYHSWVAWRRTLPVDAI